MRRTSYSPSFVEVSSVYKTDIQLVFSYTFLSTKLTHAGHAVTSFRIQTVIVQQHSFRFNQQSSVGYATVVTMSF